MFKSISLLDIIKKKIILQQVTLYFIRNISLHFITLYNITQKLTWILKYALFPFHLLPAYLFSIANVTPINTDLHVHGRELYSYFTACRCMIVCWFFFFSRLSAKHDGDGNTCNGTSYFIMASFSEPVQNQNPWKFSPCSVDYFTTFINKLNQ